MPRPSHISHTVLRSYDVHRVLDWYRRAFQLEVVVEGESAAFATFDDEHHRFAFTQLPGEPTEAYRHPSSFAHSAYAFACLDDLLEQYRHMTALGIAPDKCVNHGPTVSLYYSDPDGNGIEFFVDRFPTMAGAKEFMRSQTFRKNMVGYPLDPELLLKGRSDGVSEAELMTYDQDLADAAAVARRRA